MFWHGHVKEPVWRVDGVPGTDERPDDARGWLWQKHNFLVPAIVNTDFAKVCWGSTCRRCAFVY